MPEVGTAHIPAWSLAGGQDSLVVRLNDPATRQRIEREMVPLMEEERGGGDLSRIQFRVVPSDRRYDGKNLADLARDRRMPVTTASGIRLVIELQKQGGCSAIYHSIDEGDVVRIMQHPLAMFETDGDPVGYGVGFPHPRSYGAFPRVLARYVRELHVLTLEQAIRKMASMPARQIGERDRGELRPGSYADIVVFDPDRVEDRDTYTDPHEFPFGIPHVVINGVPVIRDGALTGATPGMVLKGPAR